jgi:hypothetical protein
MTHIRVGRGSPGGVATAHVPDLPRPGYLSALRTRSTSSMVLYRWNDKRVRPARVLTVAPARTSRSAVWAGRSSEMIAERCGCRPRPTSVASASSTQCFRTAVRSKPATHDNDTAAPRCANLDMAPQRPNPLSDKLADLLLDWFAGCRQVMWPNLVTNVGPGLGKLPEF